MPSVADELAELRKRSLAKNHAAKFQGSQGLSTPQKEAATLKESKDKTRTNTYSKAAVEKLKAGTKALDQDLDFKVQQTAQKKEEQKKQREAAEFNKAGIKAVDKQLEFEVQQMEKKKEEQEKQKEATKIRQRRSDVHKLGVDAESMVADAKAAVVKDATPSVIPASSSESAQEVAEKSEPIVPDAKAAEVKDATPSVLPTSSSIVADKPKNEPVVPDAKASTVKDATPSVLPDTVTPKATEAQSSNPAAPASEGTVSPVVEDIPVLETVPEPSTAANPAVPTPPPVRVQNRAEKKARKMMDRLNMKAIPGIARVTLKMRGSTQGFFTIYQPDVFEKSGSYVIFGEAVQGTGMPPASQQQQQQEAAQQLASVTPVVEEKKAENEVEASAESVDETGVDAKDIDLVISQAGCSRARAVAALKENDGDLVNAIMSLTA